jgi:hypothetical protein
VTRPIRQYPYYLLRLRGGFFDKNVRARSTVAWPQNRARPAASAKLGRLLLASDLMRRVAVKRQVYNCLPYRSRWCGHRARGWSARVVFKDDASGSFASRVLPGWRIGLRLWRHKRRSPLRGIGPIVGVAVDNLGLVGDLDAVFINPEGRRP